MSSTESQSSTRLPLPLERVVHVNLNCTNIEDHKCLLELLGFSAASALQPEPQNGADMGIEGVVQWDGYAMISSEDWESAMLDLLTFKHPPITGQAYATLNHIGYSRLVIAVSDLDAAHRALESLAKLNFLSPLDEQSEGEFSFCDADGTWFDVIAAKDRANKKPGLAGVVANCNDLTLSRQWYVDILGHQVLDASIDGSQSRLCKRRYQLSEDMAVTVLELGVPERNDFFIRLQRPSEVEGMPYKEPNHVGLYRMAFAVSDIQVCYHALLSRGVDCPLPPVFQDMGPGIPVDGVWALYFYDPNGICVELIQNPEYQL